MAREANSEDVDHDLPSPPLTALEVDRRMPSLALIENDAIREQTRRLTRYAPAYFWERPGSTAGYHNAHEHGLWAHTLKLSTVIERLADSYTERGLLRKPLDVDRAHAAAILHDQRKAGEDGEETQSDHDWWMGGVVRQQSELGETVGSSSTRWTRATATSSSRPARPVGASWRVETTRRRSRHIRSRSSLQRWIEPRCSVELSRVPLPTPEPTRSIV